LAAYWPRGLQSKQDLKGGGGEYVLRGKKASRKSQIFQNRAALGENILGALVRVRRVLNERGPRKDASRGFETSRGISIRTYKRGVNALKKMLRQEKLITLKKGTKLSGGKKTG